MKRKFSFNLAPVKVPSKSDLNVKATSASSPSPKHELPKANVSSLTSPWINRRGLDSRTENELRAACALILQDYKPSGHEFDSQAKPKLDFQGINRPRNDSRVYKPVGRADRPPSAHDTRKYSRKPETPLKDVFPSAPAQANISLRRADQRVAAGDKEQAFTRSGKPPSIDVGRSTVIRNEHDSDDATSLRTPLTSSTEAHYNNASTAPTSAALTSSRSSKRTSRQLETSVSAVDAVPVEWRHHDIGKRPQNHAPPLETKPTPPTPSRSRSIRSEIKEYIFPGSSAASRKPSSESMRPQELTSDPKRGSSSYGWRSWGLQRKSSSRASSRPASSKGRIETREDEQTSELDLNRQLPPLPSLDQWNDQKQQAKENRKSMNPQGTHIATVMRGSTIQHQKDYEAAILRQHRRSGSDSLALQYTGVALPLPPNQAVSARDNHRSIVSSSTKRSSRPRQGSAMDFDELMSTMDSTKNFDDQLKLNGQARNHSISTNDLRQSRIKASMDHSRPDPPPNFSRKISIDVAASARHYDHTKISQANVVQIGATSDDKPNANKSKLRKVFSSWTLRKGKKGNWMDKVEQNGIKGGVMTQDGAAMAPVVRY